MLKRSSNLTMNAVSNVKDMKELARCEQKLTYLCFPWICCHTSLDTMKLVLLEIRPDRILNNKQKESFGVVA